MCLRFHGKSLPHSIVNCKDTHNRFQLAIAQSCFHQQKSRHLHIMQYPNAWCGVSKVEQCHIHSISHVDFLAVQVIGCELTFVLFLRRWISFGRTSKKYFRNFFITEIRKREKRRMRKDKEDINNNVNAMDKLSEIRSRHLTKWRTVYWCQSVVTIQSNP